MNEADLTESLEPLEALGESEAFLEFQTALSRVAPIERPVLVIGERGTGKELAARRLHFLSKRWNAPLVSVNCGALTPSLIESELFGYEAGAFTGASKRRLGRFERADGGTLFLDELGNIPMEVQAKILRVVEYGSFERVGGVEPVSVDVRLIGATNANLPELCEAGKFMPDLLDRLSFEVLNLPPLREREGDIHLLARHFSLRMALELGWENVPEISDSAWEALESYAWPGNIRELKNVVERIVYRSDGEGIDSVVFDPFSVAWTGGDSLEKESLGEAPSEAAPSLKAQIEALELEHLKAALKKAQFNQKKASELMNLSYHQFRGLYRKYSEQIGD